MPLRWYVYIWLAVFVFLSVEYTALNGLLPLPSVLRAFEARGIIPFNVSAKPGRTLSLYLGWSGLILMIVMNVYSMRKRMDFLQGLGKLSSWLNFHVFCGLVGPTFVLFHCNFKVRGLVAISFWSMVISFTSGIIGRYFYLQIAMAKVDYQKESDKWLRRLKRFLEKASIPWNDLHYQPYLQYVLNQAGAQRGPVTSSIGTFFDALAGDLRLRFSPLQIPRGWPTDSSIAVKKYAVNIRRANNLEAFQRLMGYWHAFHFPFAIFMYIAAAIHVASSLILGV